MKFIYACDIHGSTYKYNKLLLETRLKNIKYLVFGGDLLPKNTNERQKEQKNFINGFLDDYFYKLEENGISCICILGNDDLCSLDDTFNKMCQKHKNVFNIDEKLEVIEDISFIGLSKVLDHPFGCKDRVVIEENLKMQMQLSSKIKYKDGIYDMFSWYEKRKTIDKMEDVLLNLPKPKENTKLIYIFHNPPFGIGLDKCSNGMEVGSKAMVEFFKKQKPYFTFHGHIHESYQVTDIWKACIGNTICIQPGQTERGSKNYYYVLVDTDTKQIDLYLNSYKL